MDLLWPSLLLLFVIIPIMIAAYLWMLRRKRVAMRYSSLSLIHAAQPPKMGLRRHLPFALLMLALAALIFAVGRPVTVAKVPTNQTTIMLTMDVSGSMCQTDIQPSRIDAAKAAVRTFIESQDSQTQIGIVAFAGFAELVQPPINDEATLMAVVNSLLTARGTAMGSGILEAIDAIAEIDPSVAPSTQPYTSQVPPTPVPNGAYVPAIIVVLTDGVTTQGASPIDAAQQAADRGIRVYTIGFGTDNPPQGFAAGCRVGFPGGGFGGFGGGFGGGGFRRGIDDETLQFIADMTGGEYYTAESGSDLQEVFENLPTNLIIKTEVTEISVAFAALGGLLAMLAVSLSLMWRPLP
jgi:Ca-activated chloride channel homolog